MSLSLILLEYCNINTDPIQKKRGAITRKPKTWCFTKQNTLNHHCAQPPQQKALCFTFFSQLPSPHLQNLAIHIFFSPLCCQKTPAFPLPPQTTQLTKLNQQQHRLLSLTAPSHHHCQILPTQKQPSIFTSASKLQRSFSGQRSSFFQLWAAVVAFLSHSNSSNRRQFQHREGLSSEFSSSSNFFSSGQHLEQHQHHKAATVVEDHPPAAALHQHGGRELHQQSLQQPHRYLLFQPWMTATTLWAVIAAAARYSCTLPTSIEAKFRSSPSQQQPYLHWKHQVVFSTVSSTPVNSSQQPGFFSSAEHQPPADSSSSPVNSSKSSSPQPNIGLSISGSVRFWTKINNQTEIIFFNRIEPKISSNRLISV